MAKADTKKAEAKKTGPIEFIRQVRAETAKVTWPSRKETGVSTIAVFVMVTLAAAFLFLADQIIAYGIQLILSL